MYSSQEERSCDIFNLGVTKEAERYLAAVSDRLVQQRIQVTERRVVVGDPPAEIRAMISAGQLVVMVAHTRVHLIRWFDTLVDDAVKHRAVDVLFLLRSSWPNCGMFCMFALWALSV